MTEFWKSDLYMMACRLKIELWFLAQLLKCTCEINGLCVKEISSYVILRNSSAFKKNLFEAFIACYDKKDKYCIKRSTHLKHATITKLTSGYYY